MSADEMRPFLTTDYAPSRFTSISLPHQPETDDLRLSGHIGQTAFDRVSYDLTFDCFLVRDHDAAWCALLSAHLFDALVRMVRAFLVFE